MDTIGRYKILDELGRGGCGVVYRALDPGIGRTVAIKTILADSQADESLRERFRREARSAGILSHPNIVTIHEFNDTGDVMFIAMEYIDGKTLAHHMREGLLLLDFALATIHAAADALDSAHAHGIVHRDVKPANFLITKSGHLKMADFGIAKILDSEVGLTHTGMVVGTAQYMSPEQIAGKEITGYSDQFSLAVIAYEMLAGQRPFQGNSWVSMMHAIISTEPPPVTEYRHEFGEAVSEVLRKGLAKEAKDRYPSCKAFADALERSILGATSERPAQAMQTRTLPLPMAKRAEQAISMPHPASEHAETVSMMAPKPGSSTTGVRNSPTPSPTIPAAATTAAQTAPPVASHTAPGRSWAVPLATGVIVVLGLGGWIVLRNIRTQNPAQPPAAPAGTVTQNTATPPPAAEPIASPSPSSAAPVSAPSPLRPEPQAKSAPREPARETAPVQPVAPPPSPVQNAPSRVSPPVVTTQPPAQPVAATPSPSITPTPSTAPATDQAKRAADEQAKRAADDQAKRAADEQAKRAADEQAKRTADEQAHRAADEQAKAAVQEKAKSARAAELQAVSRALTDYTTAYGHKDSAALQTIWPSISKSVLEDIRRSFHDASEVKMDLRPLADPEISGNTASVTCDRNLRQVISKKVMQASNRVRITLSRRGTGWVISSIDTVN